MKDNVFEIPQELDCAACGGKAVLDTWVATIIYRGRQVTNDLIGYKCKDCGETFTTTATDELNICSIVCKYYSSSIKVRSEVLVVSVVEKLQEALLPENTECDGGCCTGCWKDIVREVIQMLQETKNLNQ